MCRPTRESSKKSLWNYKYQNGLLKCPWTIKCIQLNLFLWGFMKTMQWRNIHRSRQIYKWTTKFFESVQNLLLWQVPHWHRRHHLGLPQGALGKHSLVLLGHTVLFPGTSGTGVSLWSAKTGNSEPLEKQWYFRRMCKTHKPTHLWLTGKSKYSKKTASPVSIVLWWPQHFMYVFRIW